MLHQAEFKVSEEEVYELKLRTIDTINLEKKLNKNVMDIFMDLSNNKLPKLSDLLMVIVYSGKAKHPIELSEKNIFHVYDRFLEAGGSMLDLIPIVIEVFKTNGLIPESVDVNMAEAEEVEIIEPEEE